MSRVTAAIVTTLVLASGRVDGQATDGAPPSVLDATTLQALSSYMENPARNRRAVLALRAYGVENLPPPALLALADAYLRSGQTPAAQTTFVRALAASEGTPWATWANLGLGWIALAGGDIGTARTHFQIVEASVSDRAGEPTLAAVSGILALLDAADGHTSQSVEDFQRIGSGATSFSLRIATQLGRAYAYYWARDFGTAAVLFRGFAAEYPNTPLTDDARYGEAWSLVRNGQRAEGIALLQSLAGDPDTATADRATRDLVDLQSRAILRRALRRYRRQPVMALDQQLAAALDLDGRMLARAALRRLGEQPDAEITATAQVDRPTDRTAAPQHVADAHTPMPAATDVHVPASPQAVSASWSRWWLLAALLAALAGVARHRRTTSSSR
ncbi:MAG TPA: tetratricopeptide repeat protein [Candidatus Eisenbacteria bacterium]|nr:tetratricopeptide repeat protein [Candidatus Eisenbacteria bacterium]